MTTRLSQLWHRSMLHEFVSWWARQMRGFVPDRLLPDAGQPDALVAVIEGDADNSALCLSLRRNRQETVLGRFQFDDDGMQAVAGIIQRHARTARSLALRLGPNAMLERHVVLPLAAERDIHRVLGYEMDRFTPFRADSVVWDCEIEHRDRSRAQLELQLWLVPQRMLQPIIDRLTRIGITPSCLEASSNSGVMRRINLGATARAARVDGPAVTWAIWAVACLAIAAVVTPFVTQSLALKRVERRIAELQPRVTEAETLRRRIADGTASADVVASERARSGDVLQVLAAITDVLPDDTVLSDLSLNQGKLGIGGQSPTAARLIPALAADPTIHNPSFAAPVTRTPDGRSDAFVIRAESGP
jgi:general secretion pathway protein L